MNALFAHLPEGLIAVAIIAVVAGMALPAFQKAGFGWLSSAALSVLSGILVVGVFVTVASVRNALDKWRAKKPPDETG